MSTTVVSRSLAEVVGGLGTIVGVWAHPDDEAYLSGGLMAAAVDVGARVVCITATRGEWGPPDHKAWPPKRLAALRETERVASLTVLGVTEHVQLGYPDGGCAEVPTEDAVGRLAGLIADVRPDTVLTFGPDGMTGHVDHRTVSGWTTAAVARSTRRGNPDSSTPPRPKGGATASSRCIGTSGSSPLVCRVGWRPGTLRSTWSFPTTSSTARWPR